MTTRVAVARERRHHLRALGGQRRRSRRVVCAILPGWRLGEV